MTGPDHEAQGRDNEDAWAGLTCDTGAILAVADGIGSARNSQYGAKSAVGAAVASGTAWLSNELPAEGIPADVTRRWSQAVAREDTASFATTILLACTTPSGDLLATWLGDGLICATISGVVHEVTPRRAGFSDVTTAMTSSSLNPGWRQRRIEGLRADDVVMLASDGISDDLQLARLGGLLSALRDQLRRVPATERDSFIRSELRSWPTPGHRDDKTLAGLLVERP